MRGVRGREGRDVGVWCDHKLIDKVVYGVLKSHTMSLKVTVKVMRVVREYMLHERITYVKSKSGSYSCM